MPGAEATETAPPSGRAPGENQLGGGGLNILLRAQWRETYQVGEGAPAYTAAGSKISLQHQEEVEPDENRALQMLTHAPPPPIVNYFRESQHQSKEVSGTK